MIFGNLEKKYAFAIILRCENAAHIVKGLKFK